MNSTDDQIIRVFCVDDHPLFRLGLAERLDNEPDIQLAGQAANAKSALEAIPGTDFDVALLDIDLPDQSGFAVAESLLKEKPNAKVIFLSVSRDSTSVKQAIDTGAMGYVLKENAANEVVEAIRSVQGGKRHFTNEVMPFAIQATYPKKQDASEQESPRITPMERRVLRAVADGNTNKAIADLLFISPRTVHKHRQNLCEKLGLRGQNQLLKYALENRETLDL